jgi:hypothetical protein
LGAAVDDATHRTALHEVQGVSAVLGVPPDPAIVEWLEFVVSGVLRREE